jgi:hypothetical protein
MSQASILSTRPLDHACFRAARDPTKLERRYSLWPIEVATFSSLNGSS